MLRNEQLVRYLMSKLSNFYDDFVYDVSFIEHLFDAYIDAVNILYEHALYLYHNTSLNTAEVYKTITRMPLTLRKSLYDISTVSDSFFRDTGLNWFDPATPKQAKVSYLDSIGKYELLTDFRSTEFEGELILNFDISKDFSGLLGYYTPFEDYVYKDYKLYLFNELAKIPPNSITKTVLLKNVRTNDYKLDTRWGISFPDIYSVFITQPEYKDMLSALVKYNAVLDDVNKVIKTLNLDGNTFIRDSYTRKNIPPYMLNTFDKTLDPFEFIFKLPPDFIGALYYLSDDLRSSGMPDFKDFNVKDLGYLTQYLAENPSMSTWIGRIINIYNFVRLFKPSHTNFFLEGTFEPLTNYGGSVVDKLDLKFIPNITSNYGDFNDTINLKMLYNINRMPEDEVLGDIGIKYGEYKYSGDIILGARTSIPAKYGRSIKFGSTRYSSTITVGLFGSEPVKYGSTRPRDELELVMLTPESEVVV